MAIKVAVTILPRDVILDTQGRAVEQSLLLNQMPVERVRVGKYIEVDILETDSAKALAKADEIAKTLLCNLLIEKYTLQVVT